MTEEDGLGRASMPATLAACCGALAATPARLIRPRQPDASLLARIQDHGAPQAQTAVRLTAVIQAHQSAPAMVVAQGAWQPLRLLLGMTTFLVEHRAARFLIDPGMCANIHRTVLRQLPMPLRRVVAPVKPVVGLAEALSDNHIHVEDIEFVLPTHLHWDHVSGLLELPRNIPVRTSSLEQTWAMNTPVAPFGVARGPLKACNFAPYTLDGPPILTFERSHDLFGDGSVTLVDLAGHTPGSVGVLLAVDDGSRVLLAGDAAWHRLQIKLLRPTAPFPGRLTDTDRQQAFESLHRLHALPNGIEIIPSHDYSAAAARQHAGTSPAPREA